MAGEEFSLPPLLTDSIQGRLDFIILRPVLIPTLLSNEVLQLKFSWWGSSHLHNIRFLPNAEEVKIVFNICCDLRGLQRYLDDASDLEIHITVLSHLTDDNKSENVKPVIKGRSFPPCKYTQKTVRSRKEWKCGDYVGKFVVSNLHFNARGEYVNECDIFNSYGDHCGSVVIFMLHTDQTSERTFFPLREQSCTKTEVHSKGPSFNDQTSPKPGYLETRFPRKNLSPRFVHFEKDKKDVQKREQCEKLSPSHNFRTKKNPQKKTVIRELKLNENLSAQKENASQDFRPHKNPVVSPKIQTARKLNINKYVFPTFWNSDTYKSKIMSTEQDLQSSCNEDFIITRLFSFVDSGAIFPSDLPALIQICQGRCPSIEFDSSELNLTYHEALKKGEVSHSQEKAAPLKGGPHMINREKKNFNFSEISSHSESLLTEAPKVCQVFDEKFMSLISEERMDLKNRVTCKAVIDENGYSDSTLHGSQISCSKDDPSEVKSEAVMPITSIETSLFILTFHSIQFTLQNFQTESDVKKVAGKNTHRNAVRQRSKLCYFVEVLLEFEGMEKFSQSALYVSRRVGNKEVIFGASQIFRFPESSEGSRRNECYLKFRVSLRRLGNRLRDDVGVGIISLERLRASGENVVLPLWATSGDSECSAKTKHAKGNVEMPLGNLHFSVVFAYAKMPRNIGFQNPDLAEQLRTSYDSNIISNNNNEETENPENVPQRMVEASEVKTRDENDSSKECFDDSRKVWAETKTPISESTSLVIENRRSLNFVPTAKNAKEFEDFELEVHLEIVEGNGLPLLRRKGTQLTFPPNCYVQTVLRSSFYRTAIAKCTTCPKWNYAADFKISPEDLKDTKSHLVLKLFHCLEDASPQLSDPMLGFATIDAQYLWNSFISLCGWIPVLNLDAEICGELKVSLTPKSRFWPDVPVKERDTCPLNEDKINSKVLLHQPPRTHILSSTYDGRQSSMLPTFAEGSSKDFSTLTGTPDYIFGHSFRDKTENIPDKLSLLGSQLPQFTKELCTCSQQSKTVSFTTNLKESSNNSFISEEIEAPYRSEALIHETVVKQECALGPNEPPQPCSVRHTRNIESDHPNSNGSPSGDFFELINKETSHFKSEKHEVQPNLPQIIEGLQWMNHFASFDTPCVSYLDLGHVESMTTKDTQIQKRNLQHCNEVKQRKSRIAANLKFL